MPKSSLLRCCAVVSAVIAFGVVPIPGGARMSDAMAATPARPAKAAPAPVSSPPSAASEAAGIVAVVNDGVITRADLTARIKLGLLSTGMNDTPEAREHVRSQVLRQMIDERLQSQEAKRIGVTASEDEVNRAVAKLAEANKMTVPQVEKMLADRGIPSGTLRTQVRAMVDWRRVIQRMVAQEVTIGDDEIDAALDRHKQSLGKPERLLAEIFLAVDRGDQDAEVRRTAERLLDEIRRTGNFAGIARQFSQAAGASTGGDLGWVRDGDLAEELESAVRQIRPGQLTAPIRTADGYHILVLRAQRTIGSSAPVEEAAPPPPQRPQVPTQKPDPARARVNLKQLIIAAEEPTEPARKAAAAKLDAIRKTVRSCTDFEAKAKAQGAPGSGDMGMQLVRDLQPGLQQFVLNQPLGRPSPIMTGDGGAMMLIVCKRDLPMIPLTPQERAEAEKAIDQAMAKVAAARPAPAPAAAPAPKAAEPKAPTREQIEDQIVNERAEQISRRRLRDLHRSSIIEIRS